MIVCKGLVIKILRAKHLLRVYNDHSLQVSFSFVSLLSNARLTNQMKSKYTDPKLVVIDEGNNDEVCPY